MPRKLTKAVRAELAAVLRDAERARAYIFAENTVVCRRDTIATTTLHYSRAKDDAVLYEVEKEYGSGLCGLDSAINRLGHFLATH